MGGEIIAEKFALLKTRGGNGVAFTHIVEDTLAGRRAVVKISDKLGFLTLEYLKTMNLLGELELPGILVPLEGGVLEEESGYYLAFPEVGEPSLENYLRMGVPFTCGEALGIIERVLHTLEGLHGAGFRHLFINTRNIFYRPRREVTLKDPALKVEFFNPLLELIASPDFSYFSPEVMDGGIPGAEADLYAVGRLAERLLEEAADAGTSPAARALSWAVVKCGQCGTGAGSPSAGEIRTALAEVKEGRAAGLAAGELPPSRHEGGSGCEDEAGEGLSPGNMRKPAEAPASGAGGDAGTGAPVDDQGGDLEGDEAAAWRDLAEGSRVKRRRKGGRKRKARALAALVMVAVLAAGVALVLGLSGGAERAPATGKAGGSRVGTEAAPARLEVNGGPDNGGSETAAGDGTRAAGAAGGGVAPAKVEGGAAGESRDVNLPQTEAGSPQTGTGQPPPGTPAERSPATPLASFGLSPGQGQSPLQVYLDASASYDPDGSIVSYAWSFGGQGRSLYQVFESNVIPVTLAVTLTVTDDGGHSASTTRYVTLY